MQKLLYTLAFVLFITVSDKLNAAVICVSSNANWTTLGIGPTDDVIVYNGAILSINSHVAVCASLTLGNGAGGPCSAIPSDGFLSFRFGKILTVNGIVTIGGSMTGGAPGSLDMRNGYLICQGFRVQDLGTYTPGGTIELTTTNCIPAELTEFNNLIINGGTTTLNHAITIDGDLTITSGTLDVTSSNYDISIAGSWTNNAAFNQQAGTVTFNGTIDQTISGSTNTDFYNLIVDNTAGGTSGVTLNQSITVDNVLNLKTGPVYINKNTLSISNSAAAAITRTSGYLISEDNTTTGGHANNSSYVTWTIGTTTGAHIFPFGTAAGNYIPLTYNLTAGNAGDVTAATYHTASNNTPYPIPVSTLYDTTHHNLDNSAYTIDRFWHITSSGGTADLTFTYADPTDASSLTGGENGSDSKGLRAQQWDGNNTWQRFYNPAQNFNATNNTVTISSVSTALTSSKPWTLALRVHPLPIELLSFNVQLKNKEAAIYWQTAQEYNSKEFIVERSNDGTNFLAVSAIGASGNSNTLKNYSTADEDPYEGISYYRLKQIDIDGRITYSAIVPLNNANFLDILKVYPNPVAAHTTVIFKSNEAIPLRLTVLDQTGKQVMQQNIDVIIGLNSYVLDVSKLATGLYHFVLTSDMKTDMKIEDTFVKN